MTANKPMTSEQLSDLMTVAISMQRDSEKAGDRPAAMFAYAVQVAVLELRKVRDDAAALAAENAALKGAVNKIAFAYSLSPHIHEMTTIETPATAAFLAEVRASGVADEATERELFEVWVMQEICISKSTLEGLRTDNGYRNSTLSGTNYNRMWSQWKSIRAAQLRKGGAV